MPDDQGPAECLHDPDCTVDPEAFTEELIKLERKKRGLA
ncbi:hypothetical protein FHU30_002912 [Actinomadura rupiterrae]|nr:hypothetical protein [Actinomadura rupiterrae]